MERIDFQNPSLNFEKFNQSFGQVVYGNLQEIYTNNKKDSVFFYELGLLNEEWNLQKKLNTIMGKKKDLNLQPLEPQSTVLPIELYLPLFFF